STLVSHSRHRYGHQPFTVTVTRTAKMTMPTTAPLSSGSGSLNGMASQVNFPSMSTSRRAPRRTPVRTDVRLSGTRDRLVNDALEQIRFYRGLGCAGPGPARGCQFAIPGSVEGGSGLTPLLEPRVEISGRHRLS